ncbi:hypothetical protein [Aestuariivivens sediminicola]|uniref:hypothetical protein n=1 Tax=Aestuariivivens sediminicola TaxID=2913560 RepID=UPI001F5A7CD8|nr:hypothetical protein [Aestuariivivens sediminicola]
MKKDHCIIVSIALIFVLILFKSNNLDVFLSNETYIFPDSYTYIDASNLLYNEFHPHPYRPLGYAALLGLPNLFMTQLTTLDYIIFSFGLNLLFWLFTLVVLFETLMLFTIKKLAYTAAFVFMFSMGNATHIALILSETIVTGLFIFMVFFMFKYTKTKNTKHLIWSVSILNITSLFRPGMFYLGVIFCILLIVYLLRKKEFKRRSFFIFLISVILIISQGMAMFKTYGNFTMSYIDKLAWYFYLGCQSSALEKQISYNDERTLRNEKRKTLSWEELSTLSKEDFKSQIANNSKHMLYAYLNNLFDNCTSGSSNLILIKSLQNNRNNKLMAHRFHVLSKIQNKLYVILAILCLAWFGSFRKYWNIALFVSLSIIFYVILTSGVSFWQGDRFNITVYPLILLTLFSLLDLLFKPYRNKINPV